MQRTKVCTLSQRLLRRNISKRNILFQIGMLEEASEFKDVKTGKAHLNVSFIKVVIFTCFRFFVADQINVLVSLCLATDPDNDFPLPAPAILPVEATVLTTNCLKDNL